MLIRQKKTKTPRLILFILNAQMLNPLSCCFELLRVSRMMDTDPTGDYTPPHRYFPSARVVPPRVALDGKNKRGEGMN